MNDELVAQFLKLAGQKLAEDPVTASPARRALGAQLLLSEVLEYVIKGLGVVPKVNGVAITEPDKLEYQAAAEVNRKEMLDGLADVAYTMYWNSLSFGLKLDQAFEAVCHNNLEKFVRLEAWQRGEGELAKESWSLERGISWPKEVEKVVVKKIGEDFFAVGLDKSGKVRKPSSYKPVELDPFL